MSKTLLILLVGAIVALILSDVLEITFHPDRLSNVPAALARVALVTKNTLTEAISDENGQVAGSSDEEPTASEDTKSVPSINIPLKF